MAAVRAVAVPRAPDVDRPRPTHLHSSADCTDCCSRAPNLVTKKPVCWLSARGIGSVRMLSHHSCADAHGAPLLPHKHRSMCPGVTPLRAVAIARTAPTLPQQGGWGLRPGQSSRREPLFPAPRPAPLASRSPAEHGFSVLCELQWPRPSSGRFASCRKSTRPLLKLPKPGDRQASMAGLCDGPGPLDGSWAL